MVNGSGEASQTVNFPVAFIARPTLSYGYELHPDTSPVTGSFPSGSCVVHRWITDPPFDASTSASVNFSKIYFKGAYLLVLTTGPTAQKLWVHWTAQGKAVVNPGSGDGITTDSQI